eukprot:7377170-Prymnesium_polylepis.1
MAGARARVGRRQDGRQRRVALPPLRRRHLAPLAQAARAQARHGLSSDARRGRRWLARARLPRARLGDARGAPAAELRAGESPP